MAPNSSLSMNQDKDGTTVKDFSRRDVLKTTAGAGMITGVAGCLGGGGGGSDTIDVGVLSALSAGWGSSGRAFVNGIEAEVNRFNEEGGMDGTEIELHIEDTEINPQTTIEKADSLINNVGVDFLIGPISSASRDSIGSMLEENSVPTLYPVQYEGPQAATYCNEWLFKCGEVPVQQIVPLIPWLMDTYDGDSFYLIGDDYSWPHRINELVTSEVESNGGEILDEQYTQLGTTDFSSIVPRIAQEDPDFLFMTLTGASSTSMVSEIYERGHKDAWTTIGLAHNEDYMTGMSPEETTGVLSSHAYFRNLDNDANREMVGRIQNMDEPYINYLTGTANAAARFLTSTLSDIGTTDPDEFRSGLEGRSIDSPCGPVQMAHDQQMEVACTVSEVNQDLQYDPIETFDPLMPDETCDDI